MRYQRATISPQFSLKIIIQPVVFSEYYTTEQYLMHNLNFFLPKINQLDFFVFGVVVVLLYPYESPFQVLNYPQ